MIDPTVATARPGRYDSFRLEDRVMRILSIAAIFLVAACQTIGSQISSNLRDASIDLVAAMARQEVSIYGNETADQKIERAKNAVRRMLKDPDSAIFRGLITRPFMEGWVICGAVNAKNSFGGYVGFKPFVAGGTTAFIWRQDRNAHVEKDLNAGLISACL